MRIAITGANGHVGANLVRELLKENHKLRVLIHNDRKAIDNLEAEYFTGSISDYESMVQFTLDIDVVIHLAAVISVGGKDYSKLEKVNIDGTKSLVEASLKNKVIRFIHFSSIHALVHEPLDLPMDEDRPLAVESEFFYERSKAIAEEWVLSQNSNEIEVIVLSPTAIIGAYDFKPSLMGRMIILAYTNRLPALIPGGYDWVDVRDVVFVCKQVLTKGAPGSRYLISGTWTSVSELVRLIKSIKGKKSNAPIIPLWLAKLGLPFFYLSSKISKRPALYTSESLAILQSGNHNISSKKAEKDLGYKIHNLSDTLEYAIDWYKKNGYISK